MTTTIAPIRRSVAEQMFGANKAPLFEILVTDFKDLFNEVIDLAEEVKKRPAKIKDSADFAATGALSNRVSELLKRLDRTRKEETDPLFNAQKEIKAHFDARALELSNALSPHIVAANDYTRAEVARENREREEAARKLREKEEAERKKAEGTGAGAARAEGRAEVFAAQAEALQTPVSVAEVVRTKIAGGGTASAKAPWTFEITDYEKIDLEKLRHFISREAVETAIRSLVRVQKGNTTITGVRVFQDVQANFRS